MTRLRVVPEPAQYTADELVAVIRERGGRIYRMREIVVFCLTTDPEVARWLLNLGGSSFLPHHATAANAPVPGGYLRSPEGPYEWDIFIHVIPVLGEKRVWEAAGPEVLAQHREPSAAVA